MSVTQTVQLRDLVSPQLDKIAQSIAACEASYERMRQNMRTGVDMADRSAAQGRQATSTAEYKTPVDMSARADTARFNAANAEAKAAERVMQIREQTSQRMAAQQNAIAQLEQQAAMRRMMAYSMGLQAANQLAGIASRGADMAFDWARKLYQGTERALGTLSEAQLLQERAFKTWGSAKISTGAQTAGAEKAFMDVESYINAVYTASSRLKGQLDTRQVENVVQTFGRMARAEGVSAVQAGRALEQMLQGAAIGKLQMQDLKPILQQFPQIAELFAQVNGLKVGELMSVDWDNANFNAMLQNFAELGPAIAERTSAGLAQTPDIIAKNFQAAMHDACAVRGVCQSRRWSRPSAFPSS